MDTPTTTEAASAASDIVEALLSTLPAASTAQVQRGRVGIVVADARHAARIERQFRFGAGTRRDDRLMVMHPGTPTYCQRFDLILVTDAFGAAVVHANTEDKAVTLERWLQEAVLTRLGPGGKLIYL